jgi:hypothetical protein
LPIVADPDFAATSIVAELAVRAVYYPLVGRWGSFANWGEHAPNGSVAAPDGEVFARAVQLANRSDVVVLVNREADLTVVERAGAVLVAARFADIVKNESFWVYRVPALRGIR